MFPTGNLQRGHFLDPDFRELLQLHTPLELSWYGLNMAPAYLNSFRFQTLSVRERLITHRYDARECRCNPKRTKVSRHVNKRSVITQKPSRQSSRGGSALVIVFGRKENKARPLCALGSRVTISITNSQLSRSSPYLVIENQRHITTEC